MFKRSVVIFVVMLSMILNITGCITAADQPISVVLNGKQLSFDVPPTVVDGRTLVPLRAIFEALEIEVSWEPTTQTVIGNKDGKKISLQIDNNVGNVDGKEILLDVPATIIDGRTMVPARFIAESVGANVGWDGNTSTVLINTNSNGALKVHFIDVGQADSILINTGASAMLIDAGNNSDADTVVNYIKSQGITKLDYVIGTHPHEDHIGGLDAVINTFSIDKILMPKQPSNTKTFEDVLTAIKNKGMKIITPKVGDTFNLGQAQWTILAPSLESYEEANNSSIVIRLVYGNNSFMLTGDAEEQSEFEILAGSTMATKNLKSDLLKVGHHGSNSSTSDAFLKAVSPKYAVISVGKGNSYGHPHSEILNRLNETGIQIFRTDEAGTIIATSDGINITIDKEASTVKENAPPVSVVTPDDSESKINESTTFIGNKNSKIFHLPSCSSLPAEHNRIYFSTREDAMNAGHRPCQRCNP